MSKDVLEIAQKCAQRSKARCEQQQQVSFDPEAPRLWAQQGHLHAKAYELSYDQAQLDEAIRLLKLAAELTPEENAEYPTRCHNLAAVLNHKFEYTKAILNLNESIYWSSKAVTWTPRDDPRCAFRLHSLASSLGQRSACTLSQIDLKAALTYAAQAWAFCHYQDAHRLLYANNLGNLFALKFNATRDQMCIDAAIFLIQRVVEVAAAEQPERKAKWLSNLGTMIYWRYRHTGNVKDYLRAMACAQEAAQQSQSSVPSHSFILSNLADLLVDRDGDTGAQAQGLQYYMEVANSVFTPMGERLRAAKKAADCLVSLARWEEASDLLSQTVRALSAMEFGSFTRSDIQYTLRDFAGLATLASSAVIQAGQGVRLALAALESGRGIMADLYLRDRSGDQVDELVCIQQGLQVFSGPDQASFISECKEAAKPGPIVVLIATCIRCDAIIIERDRIRFLPLTKLHVDDIFSLVNALQNMRSPKGDLSQHKPRNHAGGRAQPPLVWIWETIARPVLEALGFWGRPDGSPTWPRIWWIPTGSLSQLPIHAAGIHEENSGKTVIDRCISSYSSSLRSLIRSHRGMQTKYQAHANHLLVSMPSTPGLPSLPLASKEVNKINEIDRLSPGAAASISWSVTLQDPTKEEVLRHMANAHTIHFAGHGITHPRDPLRSCMALKDWQEDPLTIEDILVLHENERKINKKKQAPFLAYLSACSTGQTLARDLADESMSLMSAFQLIGFRHTVANLWEMTDELLVRAATRFYTEMRRAHKITDYTIAWCAHVTIRELRDEARKDALNFAGWPAYVHSGP